MPPIEARRRMFAASDMTFVGPLRPGHETEVTETISAIEDKAGSGGPLTFVTLERVFSQGDLACVRERQTIVYAAAPPGPRTADDEPTPFAEWSRETATDPMLLFAFSAATANGHRIHYDQAYAREVEGYPGLVVHGPLIALLLLEAMPRLSLTRFSFRALKPAFAGEAITAHGRQAENGADLWATCDGAVLMKARATF